MDFNPAGGWPNRQPPPSGWESVGCLILIAITVAIICLCCGEFA